MRSITVSTKKEMIAAMKDRYNEIIIEGPFVDVILKTLDFKKLSNNDMEKILKSVKGLVVPNIPLLLKTIFPLTSVLGLPMAALVAALEIGISTVSNIYSDYEIHIDDNNKLVMNRKKQDSLDYDDFIKLQNDFSRFIMFSEKSVEYIEPIEKKKNKEIFKYSIVPTKYIPMFNCYEDSFEYDVLYVKSPVENNVYLKLYEFHKINFDTKYNEMIDMLQSLGAKYIKISTEEVRENEFKGNVGTDHRTYDEDGNEKKQKVKTETTFNMSNSNRRSKMFEGKYPENTRKELHEKQLWYLKQKEWQNLAKARFELGLDDFKFEFENTEEYGIDADLHALITSIGIKVGGEFKGLRKEVFYVEGRF